MTTIKLFGKLGEVEDSVVAFGSKEQEIKKTFYDKKVKIATTASRLMNIKLIQRNIYIYF